jgi:hypothetical protein
LTGQQIEGQVLDGDAVAEAAGQMLSGQDHST